MSAEKALSEPVLLKAAKNKEWGAVLSLLALGENPNVSDENGSLLHYAVLENNTEIVSKLLSFVDITLVSKINLTAIQLASEKNYWEIVAKFAESNKKDEQGKAHYGSVLIVVLGNNKLNNQEKYSLTELLLKANAALTWKTSKTGNFALHLAVINNDPATLALLLQYNANITRENHDNLTALGLAAEMGHQECVKIFLRYKSRTGTECYTDALHRACEKDRIDVVGLLLSAGVPNTSQALRLAISNRNPAMVALLSEYASKEDFKKKNNDELTPQEFAMQIEAWDCINALPKEGDFHKVYFKIAKERHIIACDIDKTGFKTLPNPIRQLIIPYLHLTTDEIDKSKQVSYLSSVKVFCEQYKDKRAVFFDSNSQKFIDNLKNILNSNDTNKNKYEKSVRAIEEFANNKKDIEPQAILLLNKFHLISLDDKEKRELQTNYERKIKLKSAQKFCKEYKNVRFFFFRASKESKIFINTLENIVKNEFNCDKQYEEMQTLIRNFEFSKMNKKSRAVSLLASNNLLSSKSSKTTTIEDVDQNFNEWEVVPGKS